MKVTIQFQISGKITPPNFSVINEPRELKDTTLIPLIGDFVNFPDKTNGEECLYEILMRLFSYNSDGLWVNIVLKEKKL